MLDFVPYIIGLSSGLITAAGWVIKSFMSKDDANQAPSSKPFAQKVNRNKLKSCIIFALLGLFYTQLVHCG